jgi:cobalt-precorrin 5A hydrolase/precorrin-3B C17-methyltransferase
VRILAISVTGPGRQVALRLPYERRHGDLAETVREHWSEVDGFVLVISLGAAVRVVAPLLESKEIDPAVVCVDDSGRYAVPLVGGHGAGANHLARQVAGVLGGQAIVTTATDSLGRIALDELSGFHATGDIAKVTTAMIDGAHLRIENELDWPLPPAIATLAGADGNARIVVTDRLVEPSAGTAVLVPPSIVAGIGTSTDATHEEVEALLADTFAAEGLDRRSLGAIATIDRRRDHEALSGLGVPVIGFRPEELAGVTVPNPSTTVLDAVGTPSVAEAAGLLGAGPGARLVSEKRSSSRATCSLSRRSRPLGRLTLVGLGPGGPAQRTPAATAALRTAECVVGFQAYLDQCSDALGPSTEIAGSPIGDEVARARYAISRAREGAVVAVVCSGDPGVYAMASIVLEEAGEIAGELDIEVIPGVTAGLASSSLLGAPLGHDHVVLSLSDLLTPWEVIERRVVAARDGDFVVVLYNPRSRARDWQLDAVRNLLAETRAPTTPVGLVTDAGRPGEQVTLTTLAGLDPEMVGMTTCVIIGSSSTRVIGGRMVTPRGYRRSSLELTQKARP